MKYEIEIELPVSGAWFKYFTGIDSLEEAETIKAAAPGNVNARNNESRIILRYCFSAVPVFVFCFFYVFDVLSVFVLLQQNFNQFQGVRHTRNN